MSGHSISTYLLKSVAELVLQNLRVFAEDRDDEGLERRGCVIPPLTSSDMFIVTLEEPTSMVCMKRDIRLLTFNNFSSLSTLCSALEMRAIALWHIESQSSST
jgi:hypothetical protein